MMVKRKTTLIVLTVTLWIGWCIFIPCREQYAYGAAKVEGALNPVVIQNISQPTEIRLKTIDIETTQTDTVFSYLNDVEAELLDFEQRNLLEREGDTSYYLLEDCIRGATERHLPVEIAQDKVSYYRRRLVKAIRELFPALNISYEHDLGFKLLKDDTIPGDRTNQQFRSEKWKTSLSQPIFRGGALWNKVNEERANLRAAKAEYDKVFFDLSIEVARAYFNYSKAQTILSFREKLLREANRALVISEEKMKAALISEIEHLNVQSQQSQLLHDLESAKEDIALALLDMQKALHLDISEPVEVALLEAEYIDSVKKMLASNTVQTERDATEQEEQLNTLLELAYENRPEFIIQKSKVDAAIYREKAAVAGWLPQMNVQVERGQKGEAYIEDDNNPPWDMEHRVAFDVQWNVGGNTLRYMYDKNRQATGVEATEPGAGIGKDGYYDRKNTVSFSLLDGLDQFVQTKETEISRKEALLELELSEKDIVSEVKESFYNYSRSMIQLKSVFKRLTYRQKLVSLAKHRSEINEIQISEYLQAEIDLISEQNNVYKAVIDYFLAKLSLSKSIGIKDDSPLTAFSFE
ncbi:MAG: TolC family protein [Candidatus Omnitrophica bacterium]|nr:TolC family protein [Candidatus Omnitrophota bacterium]